MPDRRQAEAKDLLHFLRDRKKDKKKKNAREAL